MEKKITVKGYTARIGVVRVQSGYDVIILIPHLTEGAANKTVKELGSELVRPGHCQEHLADGESEELSPSWGRTHKDFTELKQAVIIREYCRQELHLMIQNLATYVFITGGSK